MCVCVCLDVWPLLEIKCAPSCRLKTLWEEEECLCLNDGAKFLGKQLRVEPLKLVALSVSLCSSRLCRARGELRIRGEFLFYFWGSPLLFENLYGACLPLIRNPPKTTTKNNNKKKVRKNHKKVALECERGLLRFDGHVFFPRTKIK